MDTSTLVIVGAAIVVLALLLVILARTGRKAPGGPANEDGIAMVRPATELSPPPEEILPEPSAAPGLATAELAPAPLQMAEPAGPPDALTRLKGLGPKAEALFNSMGITRYDQIGAWSEADVARIDVRMGAFKGRIIRDRWVEQARFLAAGDVAGFEENFGKLG